MIDLALYLCPSSPMGAYRLNSGENCLSMLDSQGYGRFLKNGHYETLWADSQAIYRGLDTSSLPGDVYAQYSGERYGAVWCRRWVSVGDVTERSPDIRTYDAHGRLKSSAPGGVSYLHVVQHDPTWSIPETGQTVADVVELTWTFDAAGQNVVERYWYANGLGLVGFSYYGSPPLNTRFSGMTSAQPTFTPLPNFVEPTPPPVSAPVVVPPATAQQYRVTAPAGLSLRAAPNGALLRSMPLGEGVTLLASAPVPIAPYIWRNVKSATGVSGWCVDAWLAPVVAVPTLRIQNPVCCASGISSKFGVPRDYDGDGVFDDIHEGLDITRAHADCTPLIRAGVAGVVSEVSSVGDYGNHVKVKVTVGAQGYVLWYCHLERVLVSVGQPVAAGVYVGVMGTTGNSSGLHLHLNVQKVGAPTPAGSPLPSVLDPQPLIDW